MGHPDPDIIHSSLKPLLLPLYRLSYPIVAYPFMPLISLHLSPQLPLKTQHLHQESTRNELFQLDPALMTVSSACSLIHVFIQYLSRND